MTLKKELKALQVEMSMKDKGTLDSTMRDGEDGFILAILFIKILIWPKLMVVSWPEIWVASGVIDAVLLKIVVERTQLNLRLTYCCTMYATGLMFTVLGRAEEFGGHRYFCRYCPFLLVCDLDRMKQPFFRTSESNIF